MRRHHMGSHSVTCQRHLTQVNMPRLIPARKAGTLFTSLEGWKTELIWVAGYIPRWFTHPQMVSVTHPGINLAQ